MVWDEISLLSGTAKPPGKPPFQTLLALPLKKLLLPYLGRGGKPRGIKGILPPPGLTASSHWAGVLSPTGPLSTLKGIFIKRSLEC